MADMELIQVQREIERLRRQVERIRQPEQPLVPFPFAVYEAMPANLSTESAIFLGTIYRAFTIHRWYQAVYVPTTNNASNYWTLYLRRWDTGAAIATLDTSGISAGTISMLSDTSLSDSVATSYIALYIKPLKTGSPGNLYTGHPGLMID